MMLYINRYFSIFLFSLFSSNTLASLWPLWWCKKNLKKVEQKFTKCQLRGTNGQYFVFGRLPSLYTARNGLSYAFLKLGALFQGRNGKLCSFKFTLNYIIKVALRGMEITVQCSVLNFGSLFYLICKISVLENDFSIQQLPSPKAVTFIAIYIVFEPFFIKIYICSTVFSPFSDLLLGIRIYSWTKQQHLRIVNNIWNFSTEKRATVVKYS